MTSDIQIVERLAGIASVLKTEDDLKAFHRHLEEILSGEAFRGSHRSGQFLRHVVELAIAGQSESLKERMIGIELFHRQSTYDTGEDAIVRVTASDVRKRLLQHYGAYRSASEFRINLPLGSYIPEILRSTPLSIPIPIVERQTAEQPEILEIREEPQVPVSPTGIAAAKGADSGSWQKTLLSIQAAILLLTIGLWIFLWRGVPQREPIRHTNSVLAQLFPLSLPWRFVMSDPDIGEIQGLTGQVVSLSDYANHHYIPDPAKVDPQIVQMSNNMLVGDKVAAIDASIAVRIASQLPPYDANQLKITSARDLRLSDLLTDGNFILLGSFRSNLWVLFYDDRLDFRIVMDPVLRQQIIQNIHPHAGEPATYVPTAKGYETGQSFATVSYLNNPDHRGHVLILSGANAEGTYAAGMLVADTPTFSAKLRDCGIQSPKGAPSFQMILRLSTMAGTTGHTDMVACHVLHETH
jgi:hypothetical protein